MNKFNEDNLVEQTVISILKELWQDENCHINAFTDAEDKKLGRENRGEVLLTPTLRFSLKKLNPDIPDSAIDEAVSEISRDRSTLPLVRANQEVYKLLKDGLNVNVKNADESDETVTIKFFDFENPLNNDFKIVSQMWIVGDIYTKRPDVTVFVNGMPLLLLELKASHKNLSDALKSNITPYKESIPKLFWYNMGIVISNGVENKVGSLTAPYEFYNDWKKVESEEDEAKTDLRTLLFGLCDKKRFLDIFENFILFDESKGEVKKIIPRYFQYYGVNSVFKNVKNRKNLDGKLGVFWHTQGSGKSYSMVYVSQKVLRKLRGNFTFVVVTDRTQLDGQAYGNFANVGAVYEKEVRATSIHNLKDLLQQDHRQIFTTIQKFQDIAEAVSNREDIIVMTDEAHRSQYDHFALNMRKALPNASFIGFTGTPLLAKGEEKTRETFGEYVSVYNFGQSIEDKATVPLYYENRVPFLKNVNENLDKDLEQVMNFYDLEEDAEDKLEKEFSTFYHIVTREDRLNAISRDIVQHFVSRGYDGKAMVVCVDKKTAIRLHSKVQNEWQRYLGKLRLELSNTTDEFKRDRILEKLEQHEDVDMAVVVSQSQSEIEDMAEFDIDMKPIRARIINENLEEEFKKADSNLRIVFVCAMWMTGFDVPNLSTLYLDKPLKNHTLMQTIARANRVYEGKKNGVIVDYIGVFKNIEKALALYASTLSGDDEIIRDKSELLEDLKKKIAQTKSSLKEKDIDIDLILKVSAEEKLKLINHYSDIVLSEERYKKKILNIASELQSAYKSVLPDPNAEQYYDFVIATTVLASRIRDIGSKSIDVSGVKRDLEELLDRSIQTGEYIIPQHKKIKDLSKLDANALKKFFEDLEDKNIQVEEMKSELADKIEELMKRNKKRKQFMDRLNSLLDEYNSGAHDIDKLFDDLVELAKDLTAEEERCIKENLTDDELAIFDLLVKDELSESEIMQVKKASRALLEKLQTEKLVLDWREKEPTRAGVKNTIFNIVYSTLPEPTYTEVDCEQKGLEVYNFVYERYGSFSYE
ncbi:DEAD/DEAH box helicase [Candidatus Roizmanbacteria bacterium CG11_big_fil_rev_8_21_14_0_20_36_8]|uniref:Type I restriction enzyme endonuclease subunit n=1 Tax=Candidatus Roizmanbacteria bacterium CG11_big_fil_rev_8_21_14_0_20_36_8 TaxID=1974856 RepID=A0A2M6IUN9_9BACT|nr:MAG: DEAD/DEAH box helicase [Candidatus Roizmanbacteria bacterium CG11_big_fil_rev_8_21_14_0_20_36_8]